MVTAKITLENEYMSLLLSVDGMRHPMLRDLPVERTSETEDFHITRSQFADMRIAVMDGLSHDLSSVLYKLMKRHVLSHFRKGVQRLGSGSSR